MEGPSLCAALPLPRTPLLCPEVLRHIRGDGQGMRLGALPKTIEELNEENDRKIKAKVVKPKFAAGLHAHQDEGVGVFSETRLAFRSWELSRWKN
eukprot:symbB.v1.2.023804.t1/scaffold2161.1/size87477/2